jgi:hypothetical protein
VLKISDRKSGNFKNGLPVYGNRVYLFIRIKGGKFIFMKKLPAEK